MRSHDAALAWLADVMLLWRNKAISAARGGALVVSLLALGCAGSDDKARAQPGSAGPTERSASRQAADTSGGPQVEAAHQARIDEAWRKAVAGENPATTCAAVKGRAAVGPAGSATRALVACNIDIPARYFLTVVDRVEAGETSCQNLMVEVTTRLSAMTASADAFAEIVRQGGEGGGDAEGARAAGAILAREAAAGGGAADPRQAVRDRLRDRVTAVCPGEAGLILR